MCYATFCIKLDSCPIRPIPIYPIRFDQMRSDPIHPYPSNPIYPYPSNPSVSICIHSYPSNVSESNNLFLFFYCNVVFVYLFHKLKFLKNVFGWFSDTIIDPLFIRIQSNPIQKFLDRIRSDPNIFQNLSISNSIQKLRIWSDRIQINHG